jgi:hypothetical protein
MRVRVCLKLINTIYNHYSMASRSQERNFFRKKSPAAVHLTHTGHKNTRNAILSEKKAPAAVHHTHTPGFKIQERHFFRKKKRLRQCITHTQG